MRQPPDRSVTDDAAPTVDQGAAEAAQLRRALLAAAAGTWAWHSGTGVLSVSAEVRALLQDEAVDGPVDEARLTRALDRGGRVRLLRAVCEALAGDGRVRVDVQVARADGVGRWLRVAGDATRSGPAADIVANGVVADITERKRLEERLQLTDTVSRSLVLASSLDEAAPGILEAIAEATGMGICGLWLLGAEGDLGCVHVFATDAMKRRYRRFIEETHLTRLRPGEGLVGHAWSTRQPVWIESAARQSGLVGRRAPFVHGLASGAAIPLVAGDRVLGVIDVFSPVSSPRDPDLLAVLAGLGNELGQFILRQAAEASVRESDLRQRLLVSILQSQRASDDPGEVMSAAARALGTHLGVDRAGFMVRLDDEHVELVSSWEVAGAAHLEGQWLLRSLGPGFAADMEAGRASAFRDVAAGPVPAGTPLIEMRIRSGLGVPIMRAGRWHAGLYLHHGLPRRWSAAEIGLASAVAVLTWEAVERADGQRALRESEARFRGTFENAAAGVAHIGLDGRWLRVNSRFEQITGYTEEELRELSSSEITHPDDMADDLRHRQGLLAGEAEHQTLEKRYLCKDGRPVWVAQSTSLVRSPVGEADYLIAVVVDIDARKQAEERLHMALAVKDEFLGMVSHELRTPMTVIVGMSRLLAAGRLAPAEARTVAADVAASADELNELIESMLLLARLEREDVLTDEPVLLDRLIAQVVERQRERDPSRPYRTTLPGAVMVEAHPGLVQRIVSNLLSNAAKYSTAGGEIEVMVENVAGEVLVHVLDRGPGLDAEGLGRVFEPFYRAPGSDQASGIGIGLSVVQRIVEVLGGRVWAQRRTGGGSDFGFSLPRLVEGP